MKKFYLIPLVLMIAVGLMFVSCAQPAPAPTPTPTPTPTPAPQPQILNIGGLFGLTGFFSDFDLVQSQEAQIAADMINGSGGIVVNGQQYNIQLDVQDFKSTFDGVTAGANKLVLSDGVKFMIAPSAFFSPPTAAICEPAKVIRGETFITGTPQELSANMTYTFLCHNSGFEHAVWTIAYLKQAYPNVKSVVYVTPDDGTQGYVFPRVQAYLQQAGLSVVGDMVTFANETVDFSPVASRLIATGADAIFMENGTPLHAGNLLKAVRQLGSNLLIAGAIDTSPTDIMTIAGTAASTNFFAPGIKNGAPDTPPLMQEVINRVYAKYGERSIHMQTVNVLYMFKQAIEKAQSLDTTAVRDTWNAMDEMQTPYGTAHKGGLQTYGIAHAFSHPDEIWVLDNGQAKFGAWIDKSPMP